MLRQPGHRGPRLPYAIAAQIAHPDRPVFAIVGDGGLTMLLGELATCIRYKLPIRILVLKNDTLGQIKWEQLLFLGNPVYVCELQPIDFTAVARAFGFSSFTIDDPRVAERFSITLLRLPAPCSLRRASIRIRRRCRPKSRPNRRSILRKPCRAARKDADKIVREIVGEKICELV